MRLFQNLGTAYLSAVHRSPLSNVHWLASATHVSSVSSVCALLTQLPCLPTLLLLPAQVFRVGYSFHCQYIYFLTLSISSGVEVSTWPMVHLHPQLEWKVRMDLSHLFQAGWVWMSTKVGTYSPVPTCWYIQCSWWLYCCWVPGQYYFTHN